MFRSIVLACALASAVAENPTKSPSSGLHKPTWKPSSKPNEHRKLAGAPTKSPSSGLHKPTWKPSSKPAEHRTLSTREERAATKATSSSAFETADALKEIKVEAKTAKTSLKSASSKMDKKEAEFEVDQAAAMEKAVKAGQAVLVEDTRAAAKTATSATKKFLVYNMDMESPHLNRALEKKVGGKDDADPCHDGLSPRCTPPTSKPVEHRSLAGSPTKSPSSGLHKPTWKPSSKPNEHRALKQDFLQTTAILKSPEESLSAENLEATKVHAANAQALAAQGGKDEGISTKKVLADQQQETVYAAIAEEKKAAIAGDKKGAAPSALYSTGGKVTTGKDKADADPCHDGLSPRCTPPTSKPVEHRSLAGSPTKSPSSGLHKPTWKPSSKPNEHRKLSIRTEKAEALADKTATSKKTVEDKIVIKAMKSEVKDDKELLSEVDTKEEKKELKSAIKADKKALKVDESSKATTSLKSDIAELTKDIKSKAALKSLTVTKSAKDLGETPPPTGSKSGQVDQKESKVDSAKEEKAAIKAEEKLEEKKAEELTSKKSEEKKEEKSSSKTSKTSKKAEQEETKEDTKEEKSSSKTSKKAEQEVTTTKTSLRQQKAAALKSEK